MQDRLHRTTKQFRPFIEIPIGRPVRVHRTQPIKIPPRLCQHGVRRNDQSLGYEETVGKTPAIAEIHGFQAVPGRTPDTHLVGQDIFSAEAPMAASPPARNLTFVAQISHMLA